EVRPGELIALLPAKQNPADNRSRAHPGGAVTVQRAITEHAALQVLVPDDHALRGELDRLRDDMTGPGRVPPGRIVGGLGISCASRYWTAGGLNRPLLEEGLRQVADRYPHAGYAGALMDGEVGLDQLSRTVFGNWSVTE